MRSRIPERYIAMFEEELYESVGDDVYGKIYLKAYGKFLGFDSTALADHYQRERARMMPVARPVQQRREEVMRRQHPATAVSRSAMVVTPKVIQSALLALALVGIGAYFALEVKKVLVPPTITLLSPQDGLVTAERNLVIEGRTEQEVSLRINGKDVNPDGDGNFRDTLDLQEGLNEITVVGAKKHSREMTVTRRVIVTPKQRPSAAVNQMPIIEEIGL